MWRAQRRQPHARKAAADQRADADQRNVAQPVRQAAFDEAGAVQHAGGEHRAEHPARRKLEPAAAPALPPADAAISAASPSGEATSLSSAGGEAAAIPVIASNSGSAAVRMMTRMVCTTAIPATSAPFSAASMRDLRQRAGASGEQRRGRIPAMHALQIKAGAEGRAERRQRQQADGERIGADVLDQLPRHQRAQRYAEQHQHGLGDDRRQRHLPAGRWRRCQPRSSRRRSARPASGPQEQHRRRRCRSRAFPARARVSARPGRARQSSKRGSGTRRLMANPPPQRQMR